MKKGELVQHKAYEGKRMIIIDDSCSSQKSVRFFNEITGTFETRTFNTYELIGKSDEEKK